MDAALLAQVGSSTRASLSQVADPPINFTGLYVLTPTGRIFVQPDNVTVKIDTSVSPPVLRVIPVAPPATASGSVTILLPKVERVKVTSLSQALQISNTPAPGTDVEVFRNGLAADSVAAGGADDYTISGRVITPSAAGGGLVIGDTWMFKYYVASVVPVQ
jgi:hypothetical protein